VQTHILFGALYCDHTSRVNVDGKRTTFSGYCYNYQNLTQYRIWRYIFFKNVYLSVAAFINPEIRKVYLPLLLLVASTIACSEWACLYGNSFAPEVSDTVGHPSAEQ
jgi:hypothetical protein